MPLPYPIAAVLLDIDGTLLDSNAAHARAWAQALRDHGVDTDEQRIRPLIGMGGDKLLPAAAGVDAESPRGQAMAERKQTVFAQLLPGLRPTAGARALVEFLRDHGLEIVVATSAAEDEVGGLLKRAGLDDLIEKRTSSDDVEGSKPEPDVVRAALSRARAKPDAAVLVGDTPYDVEAATRAGVRVVALRCGGYWADHDLRGAMAIVDNPAALLGRWR